MPVLDLKLDYPQNLPNLGRGDLTYVYRQTHFLSGYGLFANAYLQAMCKPLPGKPKNQKLHMSRPVPMYGFCATHIQGKPARYRSLPKGTAQQALPYGHSRRNSPQYFSKCQQKPRLADICRPCSIVDYNCSQSIYQRGSWPRTGQYRIRTRRFNHRSVFVSVPVGYLPTNCNQRSTFKPKSGA